MVERSPTPEAAWPPRRDPSALSRPSHALFAAALAALPAAGVVVWLGWMAVTGTPADPIVVLEIVTAVMAAVGAGALLVRGVLSIGARLLLAGSAAAAVTFMVLDVLQARQPAVTAGTLTFVLAGAAVFAATLLAATAPRHGGRLHRLVVRLAVAAGATCAAVALLELSLQALFPVDLYTIVPDDSSSGGFFVGSGHGFTLGRPGFVGHYMHPQFPSLPVVINDLGLRDGLDETTPPQPGERSVVVLGDSFAFGTGVELEQTFQELLGARHASMTTAGLRVYGAGIPGHGPLDEARLLSWLAPTARPDVVVLALYEGNDFTDDMKTEQRMRRKRSSRAAGGQPRRPGGPRDTAPRGSASKKAPHAATAPPHTVDAGAAAGARREAVAAVGERARPPSRAPRPPAHRTVTVAETLLAATHMSYWQGSSAILRIVKSRFEPLLVRAGWMRPSSGFSTVFHALMRDVTPAPLLAMRNKTIRHLCAVAARCKAMHAALIVLAIPTRVQADPEAFEQWLHAWSSDARGFSRTAFHDGLVAACQAAGLWVVDPLPRLEAEARAGRDAYHVEGHWNAHGHEIAAELLAPVIAHALGSR